MPYLIETFDSPERSNIRRQRYQEHLDFLAEQADLLLACGAKLSEDGESANGGIYLLNVDTRNEAEEFIARDPFMQGNLFRNVVVQRWRKAYLAGECFL